MDVHESKLITFKEKLSEYEANSDEFKKILNKISTKQILAVYKLEFDK